MGVLHQFNNLCVCFILCKLKYLHDIKQYYYKDAPGRLIDAHASMQTGVDPRLLYSVMR